MRIGFIGAGKAGNSLARHFLSDDNRLSGFYSKTYEHSRQAADYVKSVAFLSLEDVVNNSDIIFITTPDGEIGHVWKQIKKLDADLKGKFFCHCSGSISSEIFAGIDKLGAYGCSVHPMRAISSKYTDLEGAFFTLDGSEKAVTLIDDMLQEKGHSTAVIDPRHKGKYHAAASISSNLVVGLVAIAIDQLAVCGFDRDDALKMLSPLMKGNMEQICCEGPVQALTGAVERCDVDTIETHLNSLNGDEKEIYRLISHKLISIAREKNPKRNYDILEKKLEDDK